MKNLFMVIITFCNFLSAFEVNTHQALTRCAITSSCSNGYTQNLEEFVKHGEIKSQLYGSEKFKDYDNKTYVEYAQKGLGFDDWSIRITNPNYLGMIEAGSVLEDAIYPTASFAGNGRFNNHFYAVQFNSKTGCVFSPYMKTSKALCNGYGTRTDNIDWALNKNVTLDHGFDNEYGLTDALYYYGKSFVGSASVRKKYQAKLFISLGHVVHLLQDLHSPAHCRDNSHAKGDYLEIYGRHDGGFNLLGGVFNPKNNYWIGSAIGQRGSANSLLSLNHYYTYEDFFKKQSRWVGYNFASESHFHLVNSQTGSGLSVNNFGDSDSLFTSQNVHPSKSETFESGSISGLPKWKYIYTEGNVGASGVSGTIPYDRRTIAMVEEGLIFHDEHMISPRYKWENGEPKKIGLNQKPLEDTAVNVMPKAVASTQAFINFFFRGQMDVSINTKGVLTIKNVSNTQLVSDTRLLTFKSGGKFKVYYHDATTDSNNPLNALEYAFGDIDVNEIRTIDLKSDFLKKNLAVGTKITVVYDGNIGTKIGGYDSYGIGMRGLSVDVANLPQIEKPVPDSYSYSVSLRTPAIKPDRYNTTTYQSYDVDKYKNGTYVGSYKLDNLLYLAWYDGSAHFGDSSKYHLDIWCTGDVKLCNSLRLTVPTDSTAGYEDWDIDWTVWNYGVYTNNITLFIQNIRNQIGQYYALTSYSKQNESEGISSSESLVTTSDWYAAWKDIPQNLKMNSLNRIDVKVMIDNNETISTHEPEKSLSLSLTIEDEMIEKEKQKIDKLLEEEKNIIEYSEIEESEIE